jgi:hypothetical protein
MKTRMVAPVVLWIAGVGATAVAGEPPGAGADAPKVARVSPTSHATQASAVKPPKRVPIEDVAQQLGVSTAELTRLHQLGFADSEVAALIQTHKRTAREMITEREVLNDVGKALDQANAQVYQLPAKQQTPERDRVLKTSLAKIRRDHRAGREEFRRILAGTSFFNADELKRLLGAPSFFNVDDLNLKRTGWIGQ